MARIICVFFSALVWVLAAWPGASVAQASCGFFEPKVTFPDGSRACLSEFAFFSRKGLLRSFPDHVALAKAHSSSYAVAATAAPERCPFARFTVWERSAPEAEAGCRPRLLEAVRKSADFGACDCETLIDTGRTRLSRGEFERRLTAYEHFLTTGQTQEQTRLAQARRIEDERRATEERMAAERRDREERERVEQARREEEQRRIAEASRAEEERKAREAEQRRVEQARREEEQVRIAEARRAEEERKTREAEQRRAAEAKVPPGSAAKLVFATRRALVIGNDTYRHAEVLKTAREDARTIAAGLERVGYTVALHTDLTERGMKAAIRTFAAQIQGGDEVAFFFAGHGLQIGSTNYLIPIDTAGENELQIRDEAIDLKRILDDVSDRRAKFTLAVIDACRDNPFRDKKGTRMIGTALRGLAPTTPATGQMIIFSAGAGQKALDNLGDRDSERNGVFTRVFVQQMQRPSIPIDKIARDTRAEVVRLASLIGHEQVPAIYDQVIGEFFFLR